MTEFLTELDLANELGVAEEKVSEWRRRYGWPHLKMGRQIRFTESDVRAIVAKHRVETATPAALPGQTALSAARSR